MYAYSINTPRQLLITVHWGHYEKSEFFDVLLAATQSLPSSERLSLQYILCDWRAVTSATLDDTDTAYHYVSYSKLRRLYRLEPNAFKSHMRSMRMAYLLDEQNAVSEILRERVRRATNVAAPTKQPGVPFYSLTDALEHLGFAQSEHCEVAAELRGVRQASAN